jgi:hypothetical protein
MVNEKVRRIKLVGIQILVENLPELWLPLEDHFKACFRFVSTGRILSAAGAGRRSWSIGLKPW